MDEREMITAAAMRTEDGTVMALAPPARHNDVMRWMIDRGLGSDGIAMSDQGFVTNHGRWVDRFEALAIAKEAGQVVEHRRLVPGLAELFSEDLW